jgi:hypothetical protein
VSSDWVLVRERILEKDMVQEGSSTKGPNKIVEAEVKVKRAGGPHRAFVSQFIVQHWGTTYTDKEDKAAMMKKRHEDYRRVKEEGGDAWAELVRLGKLGTAAGNAGGAAFGNSRSDREPIHFAARDFLLRLRVCLILGRDGTRNQERIRPYSDSLVWPASLNINRFRVLWAGWSDQTTVE